MRWRDFWRGGGIGVDLVEGDFGLVLIFERIVVVSVGMMGGDVILEEICI